MVADEEETKESNGAVSGTSLNGAQPESKFDYAVLVKLAQLEAGLADATAQVRRLTAWQKAAVVLIGPPMVDAVIAGLHWLAQRFGG